ncbi:CAP domain-containing protein [Adlercreutzia caecimuris]|uniref:CAP domain-containing protein n=1 Tax=Adlercreutzia caecimuris TaxID=671266 RepID=UPI00272AFDB7|nr:CAP domain-containing protein [Adlercreutzia caecimuris]
MFALPKSEKGIRGGVARCNRLISGVLAVALATTMTILPTQPAEAATADYQVPVTYGQTEARKMIDMINGFRTGNDAWYWNEGDATKTTCTNLQKLTYDYALEQAAMLRAAEVAVSFSHTRPNGTSCFTASDTLPLRASGENIAAGQTTVNAAFVAWREDDYGYDGQGHRRNMLRSSFTSVGIGHVTFNGIHYWVQNFGTSTSGTADTGTADGARTVSVAIDDATISQKALKPSAASLAVTAGKSVALPSVSLSLTVRDRWPSSPLTLAASNPVWTSSNSSVAAISGNTVVGKKAGTATLTVKANGLQAKVKVTVKAVKPPKTKFTSVKRAKKSLKIKWKKQTKNVTGYEIWCSTSKKFTKKTTVKTTKKAKTTSLTVKKLKAKKTYYVKIRTYYKTGGKKYYSDWSSVKKVKTK